MTSAPGGDTYDVYKRDITYDRTSVFRLAAGHVREVESATSANDANVYEADDERGEAGGTLTYAPDRHAHVRTSVSSVRRRLTATVEVERAAETAAARSCCAVIIHPSGCV
jgi:hypothetical protein